MRICFGDKGNAMIDFVETIAKSGRENQKAPNGTVTYDVIDLSRLNIPVNDYFNYNEYYLLKIQF
jgi:hypothetical protein